MAQTMLRELTRIFCEPVNCSATPAAVLAEVARRRNPAILDSARHGTGFGRYSIFACDPAGVFTCPSTGRAPFPLLRGAIGAGLSAAEAADRARPAAALPFTGGWIGYLAYEAGTTLEPVPPRTLETPAARFAFYPSAALYDHAEQIWWVVACRSANERIAGGADPVGAWKELLRSVGRRPAVPSPPVPRLIDTTNPEWYLGSVERALEYIGAGDIYQVNLSRRERFTATEPPLDTYLRLRETNPGAYSAYLAWRPDSQRSPESAILCSSPELFLELDGRRVVTRPIKGTRPRGAGPAADAAAMTELAASEKDRAELTMIVDLERNDLGRVCEFGSVAVGSDPSSPAAPYTIESHPTVHHLVAEVTGRLADGHDSLSLLQACFPGGSITGAPKVRAMQIIRELEQHPREAYTGAVGFFSSNGRAVFNIAIRTLISHHGQISAYAGGGIVADSVPDLEYAETVAKMAGLRAALGLAPEDGPGAPR